MALPSNKISIKTNAVLYDKCRVLLAFGYKHRLYLRRHAARAGVLTGFPRCWQTALRDGFADLIQLTVCAYTLSLFS